MKRSGSVFDILVRRGLPRIHGELEGVPVSEPVQVMRDRFGIPHLFAADERDLFTGLGFVHAQDRLWQMEMTRRFATGELAEIAGEDAVQLDLFTRIAGFDRMRERAMCHVTDEERRLIDAYAAGVNAGMEAAGKNLPLEFRRLKLEPRPWTTADIGAPLSINAWFLQTNYQEELLALLCREKLSVEQWNLLLPSSPGEKLPAEDFFTRFSEVRIGRLLPAAVAYYRDLGIVPAVSNNWVIARSSRGLPLLANDPHLSLTVPQIWYFCHLHCPTLNVCGASMPGAPVVVIGRNDRVAWGATNVMTDCTDLTIVKVDPEDPLRYEANGRMHRMEREEVAISVAGGKPFRATIHRTVHGTVISELPPGVEAAVVLKWYGTLEEGELRDATIHGFFSLMRAEEVRDVREACRNIRSVGQNIVSADTAGNIGWQTTGAVPVRRGYSGRLPADGSSGEQHWEGYVPFEQMPHSYNPGDGMIVTANCRPSSGGPPISHSWCAPYRYERIQRLVGGLDRATADDFRRVQMDQCSLQAERVLPTLLGVDGSDRLCKEAQELLRGWDCAMGVDSPQALIFNVFLVQFAQLLLGDLIGEPLPLFLSLMGYTYTAVDALLTSRKAGSSTAGGEELLCGRDLRELCADALTGAMRTIERTLGKNRRTWSWGRLHVYRYVHPGTVGKRGAARLLNRGPYPAPGNGSTVNVSLFNPGRRGREAERYAVHTVPSLRMVADLSEQDLTFIMGPMGQSGQPGAPHYADMIDAWLEGALTPLPLSRQGAEKIAAHVLTLLPPSAGT
jgi:penicillin amidase